MSPGRTLPVFQRVYIDGHDLSGYAIDTGEQGVEYGEPAVTTLTDPITGTIPTKPTVIMGPLNGVFDNTAVTGLHVYGVADQASKQNISVLYGIRGAPVVGDECFCAAVYQTSYKAVGSEIVTVNMGFSGASYTAGMQYRTHFGKILHVMGAETGANATNSVVDWGTGTASDYGGWLMWHVSAMSPAGSAIISIDDSANGTDWLALATATTAAIASTSVPTGGLIQMARTATVRRYTRWQLALTTSTSCTFALCFMRGRLQ